MPMTHRSIVAALTALAIFGPAPHLHAQGRVSVVVRPVQPGPRVGIRTVPPLGPLPIPSIGVIRPHPAAASHRPFLFRSSIAGLVMVDPYWWLAPEILDNRIAPAAAVPPLSGGLQLDVEPRRALVYVDGALAGTVDQFSGYFRHLETTAGYHVIEFFAPDYEPLSIAVTVVPGKTTTYRGWLNRNGR